MKGTLIKTFFFMSCPNISNSSSLITFSSYYGRHDAHKSLFSLITRTSSIISSRLSFLVGQLLYFWGVFCCDVRHLKEKIVYMIFGRFKTNKNCHVNQNFSSKLLMISSSTNLKHHFHPSLLGTLTISSIFLYLYSYLPTHPSMNRLKLFLLWHQKSIIISVSMLLALSWWRFSIS